MRASRHATTLRPRAKGRVWFTSDMAATVPAWAHADVCDLTTTGRRSGHEHTIEIWFASEGASLYLISGGANRSDWVRNLQADPSCTVHVADLRFPATARLPLSDGDERDRAVTLLHGKYGDQVSSSAEVWRRDAWIVALDRVDAS